MNTLTAERLKRIAAARAETVRHLEKATGYSQDLQKPAQIEFYTAHLAYLDALAAGEPATQAVADRTNWDVTRAVLDARAAAEYVVVCPKTGAHLRAATHAEAVEYRSLNTRKSFERATVLASGVLVDMYSGPGGSHAGAGF